MTTINNMDDVERALRHLKEVMKKAGIPEEDIKLLDNIQSYIGWVDYYNKHPNNQWGA